MIVEIFLFLSLLINGWSRGLGTKRGPGIMTRRRKKSDEKWMWVVKPGDRIFVSRTAVLPSKKLSRKEFRALEEVVNIYTKMFENVLSYASRNIVGNYYRLKNRKYRELRNIYPNIPSHYIHGLCQDAVERVLSLRRNRARQYSI
jgi:mRNA-degrading endonuclease RelE of RelBE toxin-antitoxin system